MFMGRLGIALIILAAMHIGNEANGDQEYKIEHVKTVVLDGYDPRIIFSPDRERIAIATKDGIDNVVLVDGVEIDRQRLGEVGKMQFSPDGQDFAYVKMDPETRINYVCLNGTLIDVGYDASSGPFYFVGDSNKLLFTCRAQRQGNTFVVFDGQIQNTFRSVSDLVLSPDRNRYAYWGGKDGQKESKLVIDGQPCGSFGMVNHAVFSSDGKHFAAVVGHLDKKRGMQRHLYLDGEEIALWNDPKRGSNPVRVEQLVLSPDGSRHAMILNLPKNQKGVWLDGKIVGTYTYAASLQFSPDGKRFAYVFQNTRNKPPQVQVGQKTYALESQGRAQSVIDLSFSPDSRHFSFVYPNHRNSRVYYDGKPQELYSSINNEPVFSKDSGHFVYIAEADLSNRFLVVDGKEVARQRKSINPYWLCRSRNGKVACCGEGWEWIVDDRPGGIQLIPFETGDSLRFFGERDVPTYQNGLSIYIGEKLLQWPQNIISGQYVTAGIGIQYADLVQKGTCGRNGTFSQSWVSGSGPQVWYDNAWFSEKDSGDLLLLTREELNPNSKQFSWWKITENNAE